MPPRRRSRRWPFLAFLLLLRLVLTGSASVQQLTYTVTDYTGMTYDMVNKVAVYPQTKVRVFSDINRPPSPDATVSGQSQPLNTVIHFGTKTALHLDWQKKQGPVSQFIDQVVGSLTNPPASRNPPIPRTSVVPPLMDEDLNEASRRLEAAKLKGNFTGGPGGFVIGVNPPEQSTVPRNTLVEVTMGTHVPQLRGQTIADATQILASAGLRLGNVDTPGNPGTTIATFDPQEGAPVPLNSPVSVTLSTEERPQQQQPPRATPLRVVPDVTRKSQKAANALLDTKGFHFRSNHGNINGIVVSQRPQPHSLADPTQAVDLYFELPQLPIPEARGDLTSVAAVVIKKAGFESMISGGVTVLPFSRRRVVSQYPLPGTMADAGSTVELVTGSEVTPTGIAIYLILAVACIAIAGMIILAIIHQPTPPTPTPSPNPPHKVPPPAHCTFRPKTSPPKFVDPLPNPPIRFSLTLRRQDSPPEYRIPSQPRVTRIPATRIPVARTKDQA